MAQVGLRNPETPSSQRHENEAWKAFVSGTPGRLSSGVLHSDDGDSLEPLISPGVSQLGRLGRAAGHERKQYKDGSALPDSLEELICTEEPPTYNLPDVPLTAHTFSGPLRDDTYGENNFLISASEGHQTSNEVSLHSSLEAPPGQDLAAALEERSFQSIDLNMSVSACSLTSTGNHVCETAQKPTTQHLDVMSILAMQSSIESSSEDTLNTCCNSSPLCGKGATVEQSAKRPIPPQRSQSRQQGTTESGNQIAVYSSNEDDIWRKFVFGESSDGFERALEDARKETARSLRPSTTPTSSGGIMNAQESCSNKEGLAMNDPPTASDEELKDIAVNFDSPIDTSTAVSDSHLATIGNSSPDPLAAVIIQYSDKLAQTDRATHGSSSSLRNVSIDLANESLRRSDTWSHMTRRNRPSNPALPQRACDSFRSEASFKFVPPKPFLGKKIVHMDKERQISLSIPQVRGKNPTSRRQRRRKDGRTIICTLPDFEDDPIEEFEEDFASREIQEPSLFGPLETEDEF